ncbi:hypothetical protein [Streptomyces sp. LN699]|uniref:hypothetical protein n=1 Tax=Streptomyces sp. LN699 TaxID=3112981 RepID=UPI00371C4C37
MSTNRTTSANRSTSGGALRAFFRAWAGGLESTAEQAHDPLIAWMQRARTIIGLAAAVYLVVAYPLSSGGEEFIVGKVVELGLACVILAMGSIIGITVFLSASTRDRRRDFAERLHRPIILVLMLALGPTAMWVGITALQGELVTPEDLKGFFSSTIGLGFFSAVLGFLFLVVGWLASVAVVIASVPFTLFSAYTCVFTCFRASDVHQLLPALISPLLVWALFAFQLFNGPDVAAPPEVLYTFMLGGPLSVTALSVWEVRRLRSRHGITLRAALGR